MKDSVEECIREEETCKNVGTREELIENKNSEGAEQSTVGVQLRVELQIMWYKVRLLQVPGRQRLPKLREDNKLIHIKKEINGIIEELLKENETDTEDINHLIHDTATVVTETITERGETVKNTRNKDSGKIRI